MIYSAEKRDAFKVVKIHKEEIKKGFLSSLPAAFLEKLYLLIIDKDFCIVAKENDEVVGFMAGTTDIKKLYSRFFKKYFFHSIFFLFPKIFSFSSLKKIFENLFYPKMEKDLPPAELLTVAVKKDFQGIGVAPQMLELFVAEMKKKGVKTFKVIVGEELIPAIKFYEKNGFIFLKNIVIHDNKKSRVYVFTINN